MKNLRSIHPAWLATALGVAVILWLASGMLGGESAKSGDTKAKPDADKLVRVQVRISHAEQVTREAVVSGVTAPVRSVTLRAETAGQVEQVVAKRGAIVAKNAVIVRLDASDRPAKLRQAKAVREQRRLQFEAAKRLQKKGYQTKLDLAQAKANMETAEAQVAAIEDDIKHTVIRAPFAGVLETRPVEEGGFVSVGDEVGRIIDQDPFIVRGDVSEDVVPYLKPGQPGSVTLVDGDEEQGELRYVASDADPQTRTYRVELEVSSPDKRLISGASAQLHLPLQKVMAHEVEPAILTLNADGEFGIKSVDDNNKVHFDKAHIVRNRDGKVWLDGLANTLRIITVGQGFVRAGDTVEVSQKVSAHEKEIEEPAPDVNNIPEPGQ